MLRRPVALRNLVKQLQQALLRKLPQIKGIVDRLQDNQLCQLVVPLLVQGQLFFQFV